MRIDFSRLPIGELLIGFLLGVTMVTFTAAWLLGGEGMAGKLSAAGSPTPPPTLEERGRQIAATNGCLSCHSTTGDVIVGPSWKGLFGKSEALTDGSTVTVDETYIRESILDPTARIVKDFSPVMPAFSTFGDEEIEAIIAFMQSVE